MRLSQIIVPALFLYSDAFTMPNMGQHRAASSLSMSSTEANSVPIIISGNNIEVTAALNDYVNSKLERTIGKLSSSGAVKDCDVHLTVNKNPKVSKTLIVSCGFITILSLRMDCPVEIVYADGTLWNSFQ